MRSAEEHTAWNKRILPTYEWEEARDTLKHTGNQSVHLSLERRRNREIGSKVEPELYVCKWYRTAGVRPENIGSLKYIRREYNLLSSLHHENVVRYVDFGYEPTGPRLARLYLEYCSGGDLKQFENLNGERLSAREVAQFFIQVANALLYIHHGIHRDSKTIGLAKETTKNGWTTILHRDIKPANIFVVRRSQNGIHVKLGDFGIAKLEDGGTDTYVGSREYMAPEQRRANASRNTTIKSDIWSLGETIHRLYGNPEAPIEPYNTSLAALLPQCRQADKERRPNSAAIIVALNTLGLETQDTPDLVQDVVSSIVEWDTGDSSPGSMLNLEAKANLCERLFSLGLKPGEETLHIVLAFLAEEPNSAERPAWKITRVREVEQMMRANDPEAVEQYEQDLRSFIRHREQEQENVRLAEMQHAQEQLWHSHIQHARERSTTWQQYLLRAEQDMLRSQPSRREGPSAIQVPSTHTTSNTDLWNSDHSSSVSVSHISAAQNPTSKLITRRSDLPLRPATINHEQSLQALTNEFRQFATNEKQRLQSTIFSKVKAKKQADLDDLLEFSESFQLNTPVPRDMLPILAKDQDKQREIAGKYSSEADKVKQNSEQNPTMATSAHPSLTSSQSLNEVGAQTEPKQWETFRNLQRQGSWQKRLALVQPDNSTLGEQFSENEPDEGTDEGTDDDQGALDDMITQYTLNLYEIRRNQHYPDNEAAKREQKRREEEDYERIRRAYGQTTEMGRAYLPKMAQALKSQDAHDLDSISTTVESDHSNSRPQVHQSPSRVDMPLDP